MVSLDSLEIPHVSTHCVQANEDSQVVFFSCSRFLAVFRIVSSINICRRRFFDSLPELEYEPPLAPFALALANRFTPLVVI